MRMLVNWPLADVRGPAGWQRDVAFRLAGRDGQIGDDNIGPVLAVRRIPGADVLTFSLDGNGYTVVRRHVVNAHGCGCG
jgi:hypothetical protein